MLPLSFGEYLKCSGEPREQALREAFIKLATVKTFVLVTLFHRGQGFPFGEAVERSETDEVIGRTAKTENLPNIESTKS